MHIRPLRTQHTAMGTFRRGVIYTVDENDKRFRSAVQPKLATKDNAGVFDQLTAKDVEKARSAVKPLSGDKPADQNQGKGKG